MVSVTPYLDAAMEAIRMQAYYADRVDWADAEARAARVTKEGGSLKEARSVVRDVLRELGDSHSRLLEPAALAGLIDATPTKDLEVPRGKVEDGIGYIRLPGIQQPDEKSADVLAYVRAGQKVTNSRACGWIIDVRYESGGNVIPPLAVLAPLIGQGDLLTYRMRDGTTLSYSVTEAGALVGPDGTVLVQPSGGGEEAAAPTPFAVLQYLDTASAGEGVVLALVGRPDVRTFGTRTAGVPTGNTLVKLPDGGGLLLTVSVGIDRSGKSHERAIPADEIVIEVPSQTKTDGGLAMDAARNWLRSFPGCAPRP